MLATHRVAKARIKGAPDLQVPLREVVPALLDAFVIFDVILVGAIWQDDDYYQERGRSRLRISATGKISGISTMTKESASQNRK